MNAAKTALQELSKMLPLAVSSVDWHDPILIVHGKGWGLTVMTPWRVLHDDRFFIGSDDADPAEVARLLEGNLITACGPQGRSSALDPALAFASGHKLEIFSVGPLEPWSIALDDVGFFVASPSEPNQEN